MSGDGFLLILEKYSEFALFISIGISIVIAILGVVPSVFVTGANMLFFGPFLGFIVSLIGETIGNYVSFKIYKKGIKNSIDKYTKKYKILEKIANSKGNKAAILICEGRVIPFIPSGFITLAASISEVDDFRYVVATFIGKIPSILLEMLVSYGVISSGSKGIQIVITVLALFLIYKTIKRKKGDDGSSV